MELFPSGGTPAIFVFCKSISCAGVSLCKINLCFRLNITGCIAWRMNAKKCDSWWYEDGCKLFGTDELSLSVNNTVSGRSDTFPIDFSISNVEYTFHMAITRSLSILRPDDRPKYLIYIFGGLVISTSRNILIGGQQYCLRRLHTRMHACTHAATHLHYVSCQITYKQWLGQVWDKSNGRRCPRLYCSLSVL